MAMWPPPGPHLDQPVAQPQPQLAADAVEVFVLRLVEAARVVAPESLTAAVGVAEHEVKEVHRQTVVKGGVALGLGAVPVVLPPFEPAPA